MPGLKNTEEQDLDFFYIASFFRICPRLLVCNYYGMRFHNLPDDLEAVFPYVVPVSVRFTTTSMRSGTFASDAPNEWKSWTGIFRSAKYFFVNSGYSVVTRLPADLCGVFNRFVAMDSDYDLDVAFSGLN